MKLLSICYDFFFIISCSGCFDKCVVEPTLTCLNRGRCLNLYTRTGCDCRGTGFTGVTCTKRKREIFCTESSICIKEYQSKSYRAKGTPLYEHHILVAEVCVVLYYSNPSFRSSTIEKGDRLSH